MKICILNFSSRNNYVYAKGQKRLVKSLKTHQFKGDIIIWDDEIQFGCPKHKHVPYAFKPYALKFVRDKGYDLALWLDSSFWAVKPMNDVFDIIKDRGYLMQNDGNLLGNWTHDKCLDKYGITRDEAMNISMYVAGCTGLNFHNEKANSFLDQWYEACQDGYSFQGQWDNKNKKMSQDKRCLGHRHDMSVGTIISRRLEMEYLPKWSIFTFGKKDKFPNVYMLCQGM